MAKIVIVGGGAAGLMAAGAAVRQGHQVIVLEHMQKPAQKILVTGKGRCNLTNDCNPELKVERGRRVFPVSDKAEEIRQALLRYAADADLVEDKAKKLLLEPLVVDETLPAKKRGPALRCIGVRGASGREYRADAVLVATGGLSYPTTGSTGDGYKLAQQAW